MVRESAGRVLRGPEKKCSACGRGAVARAGSKQRCSKSGEGQRTIPAKPKENNPREGNKVFAVGQLPGDSLQGKGSPGKKKIQFCAGPLPLSDGQGPASRPVCVHLRGPALSRALWDGAGGRPWRGAVPAPPAAGVFGCPLPLGRHPLHAAAAMHHGCLGLGFSICGFSFTAGTLFVVLFVCLGEVAILSPDMCKRKRGGQACRTACRRCCFSSSRAKTQKTERNRRDPRPTGLGCTCVRGGGVDFTLPCVPTTERGTLCANILTVWPLTMVKEKAWADRDVPRQGRVDGALAAVDGPQALQLV